MSPGRPVSSTTRRGTPSTTVSESMKAAVRSAGDGVSPVRAVSQGSERKNRSQNSTPEPCPNLAGFRRSCWISRRGEPERIRVPPPCGATVPTKPRTKSARGRSRCGPQGLSQCQRLVGTSHGPGSGKVAMARPQFFGGDQAPSPSRSSKTPRTRSVSIPAWSGSRLAAFRSPGIGCQLDRSSARMPCVSSSSRHHRRSMARPSAAGKACLTTR